MAVSKKKAKSPTDAKTTTKKVTKKTTKKVTAKKTTTKKVEAKKKVAKKVAAKPIAKQKNTITFPEKDLKKWLEGRAFWSHDDWLGLLNDLYNQGHTDLVSTDKGRCAIGDFLEKYRMTY
ncbi:MAG: hypothetical protein ISR65_01920 [Bacteriovoracaceae bacterium]|nr:hypothetical protein [Bacteriovoracaceae bacterium]